MNAKALAERKVARQLRHRAKTGGLEPRQHADHVRIVVDSRTKQLQRAEAFLAALAKASRDGGTVTVTPESLDCPRCGAVGLDPCRKPNGRVADKAHAGRVTS